VNNLKLPANNERAKAIVLMLVTALLWSTGGLGVKLIDLGPLAIAGGRAMAAFPVLLLAAWLSLRGPTEERLAALWRCAREPRLWFAVVSYCLMVVCLRCFALVASLA
jgi:drug/metabolite transporter (DMT)-like permease